MIIYTKNFDEAKKMLNVAMAAHFPKDVDIAIFVDDGLRKGITVEESNIDGLHIKRTYFTTYTSALDVLNDIFETVNIKDLYCIDDGGIKLQIRNKKDEKGKEKMNRNEWKTINIPKEMTKHDENMVNRLLEDNKEMFAVAYDCAYGKCIMAYPPLFDKLNAIVGQYNTKEEKANRDYHLSHLPDITVTPDDMEAFSANVAKHFKKDIAEHMAMNPLIGIDFMNAVTSASAYGFDYAVELLTNRIFEKTKKPEIKPKKMTAENKKRLLAMVEVMPKIKDDFIARPTPEELKTMQVTLTYDELAELIEELFSIG